MGSGQDGRPVTGRLVFAGLMGIAGGIAASMEIQWLGKSGVALPIFIIGLGLVAGAAALLCPQRRAPDD